MTTRVWVAQCLCPQRHCIMAASRGAENAADANANVLTPLQKQVESMLIIKALNPWCGLCHAAASEWTYEVRRTAFATMDEIEPALRQLEAEQIVTNALWGDMPRSD
jgi:hypothetical protein